MSLILSGTNGLSDVDGSAATPAIRGTDTNTGVFFPAADTVGISTGGTERARVDSSGNLGLGVTPSAWGTSGAVFKALEFGKVGNAIFGLSSGPELEMTSNAYYNSGWKYANTGTSALRFSLNGDTAGAFSWNIAASGTAGNAITFTQAMTLDASGNLLVGATSATYSASGRGLVEINGSSNSLLALKTGGSAAGYLYHDGTALSLVNTKASYIQFTTNGIDAARIDSSGNLLVGQTTQFRTGDRLSVVGTGNNVASFNNTSNVSGYGTIASYMFANGGNTSSYHFWANTSAVGNWYLYGNGTSSFSSDERLKKNIETTRDGYLQDLLQLRVVKYNWKDALDGTPKELGLIAQEVERVFPGLVQDDLNPVEEGGETYKQLKYSVLPFMLLKAIQEQQAIITQLQADVAALKGQA